MQLTQLNNTVNINQINDVKNSIRTNNLENNKETVEKHPSDKIDLEKTTNSSGFLSAVTINISKVANLQKMQSAISNQLEITSEIVKVTNSAVNSNRIQLDDKQPDIQNLLTSFNKLSEGINTTEISDQEGIFFDGQVGSRPLSASEIHDAINQQKERLSQFNKRIEGQIESAISDTKAHIEIEKSTVETKVEFKNIDYAKESAQFNASTLESVKGGILPSQANAFPLHSERLLA